MARGKLAKFDNLGEEILKVLKKGDTTTNKIKRKLEDKGIKACWITINKRLEELKKEKKVKSITIGSDLKITIWSIK